MNGQAGELLLVASNSALVESTQKILDGLGYSVTVAGDEEAVVDVCGRSKPGLALVSPVVGATGAADSLCSRLAEAKVPIVVLAESPAEAAPLLRHRPLGSLFAPFREEEVGLSLRLALGLAEQRRELEVQHHLMNGVVDGMLDSVLLIDSDRRVVFANATARRHLRTESLADLDLPTVFPPAEAGNEALAATVQSAFEGNTAIGSGSRATIRSKAAGAVGVLAIVAVIKDADGKVAAVSLSFRPSPAASTPRSQPVLESAAGAEVGEPSGEPNPPSDSMVQNTPLRAKAIRTIEQYLASESSTHRHYVVVLLLSQFDMFRLRYGLNNAEKLVHAFSAHLIKSLPSEDRLYAWSNRTVVLLLERDNAIDEVRLEMTAFCSRRVDYYLNATGRSALVTLSASWTLIPLFDCPEAKRDPRKIIEQIDAFERAHTKRK